MRTTADDVSGATATTLSFTAASADNGKQYRAVFSNSAGSATSNPATLEVNTKATPVITWSDPADIVYGTALDGTFDHARLLNRKAGQLTLLSVLDPATKQRWEETVKPVALAEEAPLLYLWLPQDVYGASKRLKSWQPSPRGIIKLHRAAVEG